MDIETNIKKYINGVTDSDGRRPDARYASFDYCFNYFQHYRNVENIAALADQNNIQLSCLHLGFYLASWGMLRGSAELLQKSCRHLVPIIEVIAATDESLWDIDAHCYSESNIQQLLETAHLFRQARSGMSDILITKVMLGVFGNVPAFDTNFKQGFNVSTFGPKALKKIGEFYKDQSDLIDTYRIPTLDFISAEPTQYRYTRAKVIDMAFFIEGEKIESEKRRSKVTSKSHETNRQKSF